MKTLRRCRIPSVFALLIALGGIAQSRVALAYDGRRGATPPRLGFVDGEVSLWRPGAEIWVPAQMNTAFAAGDSLYAGDGGNSSRDRPARLRTRRLRHRARDRVVTPGTCSSRYRGPCRPRFAAAPGGQTLESTRRPPPSLIDRAGYYRWTSTTTTASALAWRRG